MQTQIDTLRQREQWLAAQKAQLERYANLLDHLAAALAALLERERSPAKSAAAGDTELLPPRELARRTVSAREEQNRWLSQQMQDGPMQALSNLVLHAEISHRLLGRDVEKGRREVQSLKEMVVRVLNDTRHFVSELHPPALEELGLRPTVRRYVSELSARSGVEVRLSLPGQDVRLPLGHETALFRIVQEGLRGALSCRPEAGIDLTLVIDSGLATVDLRSGAAQSVAEAAASPACLETVATYAEALGGSFAVEGPDERGLHLRVEVPLIPAG
jgi:two-component system sensor histidine kinase DegS